MSKLKIVQSQDVPDDVAEPQVLPTGQLWKIPGTELLDLGSLDAKALASVVQDAGGKRFAAKQLFSWVHRRGVFNFDEMTDLSKKLREELGMRGRFLRPQIDDVKESEDGTRKYQLRSFDDQVIEAVWLPGVSGEDTAALCISSQIGCAMGCRFCATAAMKLQRHLLPGEITGQVYTVMNDVTKLGLAPIAAQGDKAARAVTNIIYMGMGEPLHNYAGVVDSIRLLTSPDGVGFAARRLTVSTSGVVPAIARLGVDTDVQIAVSLNATTDEIRDGIMPVNRKWKIATLLKTLEAFPLKTRRRITFEYVLLAGVNDSDEDAQRLARLVGSYRCKVNLIPFNAHPLAPYQRPSNNRVAKFQRILDAAEIKSLVRTTRGDDIDAACGMLGAKELERAREQAE